MKKFKLFRTFIAGLTAGAMFCSFAAFMPDLCGEEVYAAGVCTVNTDKTYQIIRGFGGMNLPEWITQGDLTDAQRKKAFGNGDDELGLTILRIYVSDDKNAWKTAVPTAVAAQKYGATVFATPWNPPSSIRQNGSGGSRGGRYHLPSSNYGAYVKHLNDYYSYMKSNGVDLYAISIQNEPDYSEEWTAWSSDETTSFLANYGDQLNFRVMSPETFQYTNKDYYTKILNNQKAFANTDLFGTHFYGTQRSQMDFSALEGCGKEIWMTEVYVPNSTANSANNWPEAIQVANNIHNGLVVGNMSAYTWWYIRRSYGLMTEDGKISKRGYCMAQYSKYVRPGDIRIEATEQPESGVYVSAYKHSDTQISIVAVNSSKSGYSQQFSVGSREITDVDRYRTSQSENLAATENLEHDTSTFWAQLPAESVSTFVVSLESDGKEVPSTPDLPSAPEPDEPDADGYYFHDTFENGTASWEGRGAAELTLSGKTPYAGKEALLVQGRTATWNGAQKALNSLTFEAGKEYSFSACVQYAGSSDEDTLMLSLQYKDSAGETKYDHIAQATPVQDEYVQLANTSYKIPAGASDLMLYVETENGKENFYIDEIIGAPKGTVIEGPHQQAVSRITGDVNSDGVINIADLILCKDAVLTASGEKKADVDQNGTVDSADVVHLQKYLFGQITEFPKAENNNSSVNNNPGSDTSGTHMSMADYTDYVKGKVAEKEPDSSHKENAGTAYGTVKSGSYFSTTCNRNKPYNVLLPANYDSSKKYPVMYVMHGYWENQNRMITEGNGQMYTRQIIGNAIAAGEAEDMIVVFPYIYSSKTQAECSGMDDANNAAYDNFINDLVTDLMPHIEKTYSVKTGKDNTAITGFSMGGRESLLIGMKYPDKFGYIGAICPAPGVTGTFNWSSDNQPYLLFITAGSDDNVVYTTPNGYHENFTKNGVPHIWHYVTGGAHGDNSIHPHLYNFCRFAFRA